MAAIVHASSKPLRIPRLSRFAWMMALYGENHDRLDRLFAPTTLTPGRYASTGRDGLQLQLDVLACHPYTLELRLAYPQLRGDTGEGVDPIAWVRHYRDAHQAEVTHCHVGPRWQDVLGLHPTLPAVVDHRMRMNVFFSKWLEYLRDQGHARTTLRRSGDLAVVA